MSDLFTVDALSAFVTLTAMEIVLGIDNIVFISILVGRLPLELQEKARVFGLGLAFLTRLVLLFSISWILSLTKPWFNFFSHPVSGRDLVLLFGGLFLVAKATFEIHHKMEGQVSGSDQSGNTEHSSFVSTLIQIAFLDIVFSLDSVITAVGMASDIRIMIAAVVVSMVVMLLSASWIGRVVDRHPTIKILALSFLILIGVMLVFEGGGGHIPKGYIYFAMAFSLGVELLNIRYRSRLRGLAK